ncbi:hypothetical protein JFL43_04890 [Viridibacillus sp. YIM B01967]|uniref:Uncharacterized protein n=1 Tax=Viridibacillus soli TaxID=2798301 RepID=A0ABS1H4X6_9BACL|nr:hypothetical protein [Viridibacillus soli]MBK3494202.1 hypothetical protein [Viridibacillus soli]
MQNDKWLKKLMERPGLEPDQKFVQSLRKLKNLRGGSEMLYKRYETRHIFMVLAICTFLISPLFVLLVPLAVVHTIHYQYGVFLVYAPSVNYWVIGVGWFFVFLAFLLLFLLDVKKLSIVLSIICIIASGIVSFGGSTSYIKMTSDDISFRGIFAKENNIYGWDEVKKLIYYEMEPEDKEASYYEFYFKDGQMLTIKENGHVAEAQRTFFSLVQDEGVEVQYVTKEE